VENNGSESPPRRSRRVRSSVTTVTASAHDAHRKAGHRFQTFAQATSRFVGTPNAFISALGIVTIWGLSGPVFRYSDTWQLVINTGTTIVTFLMVFLIQHTQNHDTEALRLKLDELIRAVDSARNEFIDLDELTEDELRALHADLQHLTGRAKTEP
jgi:low affinity Fe/Cu permease